MASLTLMPSVKVGSAGSPAERLLFFLLLDVLEEDEVAGAVAPDDSVESDPESYQEGSS